jgi:hypothetical protein
MCKHLHQTGNLAGQWWCTDCGKALTANATDRRLFVTTQEIYKVILETVNKNGSMTAQQIAEQLQFAEEIIKLTKGLYNGH